MNTTLELLSTVVAPSFSAGQLIVRPVSLEELPSLLARVSINRHGHPATITMLRRICPELLDSVRGFWDGSGEALVVRPRGGVRMAAQVGDTEVTRVDELEATLIRWVPANSPI